MVKTCKKIHIIGAVGSDKTTLARKLSTTKSVPMYELDNLVWVRKKSGDVKRSPEKRDEYLTEIIQLDQWIIEGADYRWVNNSLLQADLIIFLDVPYERRVVQIIKRYVRQKLGIEKANYKPSLKMLRDMLGWSADYQRHGRNHILKLLESYERKVLMIKNNQQIKVLLDDKTT